MMTRYYVITYPKPHQFAADDTVFSTFASKVRPYFAIGNVSRGR